MERLERARRRRRPARDAPSWHAATSFTSAYVLAVWKALVAALLISAALQSLVPRAWLLRALNRRDRVSSALAGGLYSTPSMMCTCCTAPVASALRRSGVPTAGVVAYWLGNPLLNPAVLVFLLFVAPWQWTVTRLVDTANLTGADEPEPVGTDWLAAAPARFGRALLRLSIVLVGRAFGCGTTAGTAAVVVAGGVLGAGLLTVL